MFLLVFSSKFGKEQMLTLRTYASIGHCISQAPRGKRALLLSFVQIKQSGALVKRFCAAYAILLCFLRHIAYNLYNNSLDFRGKWQI